MSARSKVQAAIERASIEILEAMGREDRMGPIPKEARDYLHESLSGMMHKFTDEAIVRLAEIQEEDLVRVIRENLEPIARSACAAARPS